MSRRRHRLWPLLDHLEPWILLSNITDIMAQNSLAVDNRSLRAFQSQGQNQGQGQGQNPSQSQGQSTTATPATNSGFAPSTSSIAVPSNQGAQGTNLALMPTGTLTPREQKRERFTATFQGHYTVGKGGFSSQALLIHITGVGGANTMLHPDIQMRIVTPVDPSLPNSGVLAIFDRNLNSNTVLGFDFTAPYANVDRAGRPNHFDQVSIDANESSGVYDEAYSQGVIQIRYLPSTRKTPGVINQGTAIVKIQAQIYTTGVDFILANSHINP